MFTTKESSVSFNNEAVSSLSQFVWWSIQESKFSDNDQSQAVKCQDQANISSSTQIQHEYVESRRIFGKDQYQKLRIN